MTRVQTKQRAASWPVAAALCAAAATVATLSCGTRAAGSASAGPSPQETAKVAARPKPLLREFVGLNTHTTQFRPELYKPVTRLLRDYHNLKWDVGNDTSAATRFPMSENGVNWQELYGGWRKAGYGINVCVQFSGIKPTDWKDVPKDAYRYGESFARFFGPSGKDLAEAAEIGNEPGDYPDPVYRTLFENMAKGMRAGDPKLKIATCATFAKESGKYHKSLSTVKGLEHLYDVINLHSYAQAEGYPTWRRSFPEDPKLEFLKDVEEVIAWRDANAPGKEVWLTEFGWDSTTKPNLTTGDFVKWEGVTDAQQAQYIVRAFLGFTAMDLDRAYLYWFNDGDKPTVHASSGLTRDYQPKPSFHAVAHLLGSLGEYRFARAVDRQPGKVYAFEFRKGSDPADRVWAVWSPTGSGRKETVTLTGLPGKVTKAERMPLAAGPAEKVALVDGKDGGGANGEARLEITESPTYLWMRAR
ncbi:MAG TPA: hypothetical protein VM490_17530 [Armatimonadaceae bacterium]|nr:hypothetical protein [Armatimonadaceae bacterium]